VASLVVVLLNNPKLRVKPVLPIVFIPAIWKLVPTAFVRNTLPLPLAPVYPEDTVVFLTSPEPVKVYTPLFCQPVYAGISVVAPGLPIFSVKTCACASVTVIERMKMNARRRDRPRAPAQYFPITGMYMFFIKRFTVFFKYEKYLDWVTLSKDRTHKATLISGG
jgi:hypothetical protein